MLGSFSVQASAASKKKTLIVYYSRTGTTKEAAKKIQKLTGADASNEEIVQWMQETGIEPFIAESGGQENTELYDFELTDEEMEQINALNWDEKHDWY